ncbi:MAG TPA: beta-L-arabinofuranosidase domain-containing protein [Bryobacteraceae bacterium]|nr:beta-L-arabinofuranosidase domain-containing protein [Bryobacteraceae bacterium]
MEQTTSRRDFLRSLPIAAGAAGINLAASTKTNTKGASSIRKIESLNYKGVRLLPSRWQEQYQHARDYYFAVSDDDILQGFRAEAGLPAPGRPLGGWCARDSATVFGQWLSGMSRMYSVTNDVEMRDKAAYLMTEWFKTVGPDGNCRMRHYPYEKLVCGLVDMNVYGDHRESIEFLAKVTDYASKTFNRDRVPAGPVPWEMHSGRPGEWYTLPENLYRAYQVSNDKSFKDFADVWLYHSYWNKFANSALPTNAHGVHAYSHVNSFSSAAMTYAISQDPHYLMVIKNAYDYLQNTQCYATGGFGPVERILPPNGNLGKALEYQLNCCEVPCCSWAALKLSHYLTEFTGESRYGDWAERIIYNCIGAALPIIDHGKHFYYADYRVGAGVKVYSRNAYTCCSGTYIQNVADYHNQIYYSDDSGLYVNLYLPSEVTWQHDNVAVKLIQQTRYPEAATVNLSLELVESSAFSLRFRVPGWSKGMSIDVNDTTADVRCKPGTWAVITRTWNPGDKLTIRIPLSMRWSAVDSQHPKRVAVMRGPVVMVQEGNVHEPIYRLPDTEEQLNKWLVADEAPGYFRVKPPDGTKVMAKFQPFYSAIEALYYRMYFDLDKLPVALW